MVAGQAAVVVAVDLGMVVLEVVSETWRIMRTHLVIVDFLAIKVLVMTHILGSPWKSVVAMVDHVVLSVVAVMVVLIMEKWDMGNALVGHLNSVVELDVEMRPPNVEELVEETGDHQMMNLLK
jgi:hypothetical protein